MNQFAGSITFAGNVTPSFEGRTFNFVKNFTKDGNSNVFFFGETEKETSKDLLESFKNIGEIVAYDLSIETEDKLDIFTDEEIDGEYNVMAISGINNDYKEVLESFSEGEEVVSIREAEDSVGFGNRVIKVDIIS